jgi:hypothetical protein
MKLVTDTISNKELKQMSQKMYEILVKAVVDIEKEIMVVDAGLHSDEEALLLENDSEQQNLWGINIFPDKFGADNWIQFDSMINIRPNQGNRTRGVESLEIQKKIKAIVKKLVTP